MALHEALLTKTYRTSPYDVFKVYEPKERLIYRLPYFPDRIVHHAIMNVLEPIWVSVFTHNTFSCVKKRGIEGCARSVERHIRKYAGKPLFILKIDLTKFYPLMPHATIKRAIRWKIKDKNLLWLLGPDIGRRRRDSDWPNAVGWARSRFVEGENKSENNRENKKKKNKRAEKEESRAQRKEGAEKGESQKLRAERVEALKNRLHSNSD